MYYPVSLGRTDWPGKWESTSKWVGRDGWVLQPYVPYTPRTPRCIVGRCYLRINELSTADLTSSRLFRGADLNLGNNLLIGTVVHGAKRSHRGMGKIVVHDMVSKAPLKERIEKIRDVIKNNPFFELSEPVQDKTRCARLDAKEREWSNIGWLVKKCDAPLVNKESMGVSTSVLRLDYYQVY
jgi:hypothetical protein